MISHEIRTPLNSVLGFARLMAADRRFDEDCLHMIISNAEAMLRLVDDLLDFACVESGHFRIEMRPFVLGSLLAEIWDLLTPQAQEKGILLEVKIAPHVPKEFSGDGGRLRQVLINLVSNAIRFTDCGHVTIRVSGNTTRVFFSVEDSGAGMAEEELETIFDPFVRCEENGGMGLGLAISKRLVELMGGSLCVESELGKGTRFFFPLSC